MTTTDVYMLARVVFLDMPDARIRVYENPPTFGVDVAAEASVVMAPALLTVRVRGGSLWEPNPARSNVLTLDGDGQVVATPATRRWREIHRDTCYALPAGDVVLLKSPVRLATALLDLRRRHLYPDTRPGDRLPEFDHLEALTDLVFLLVRERMESDFGHVLAAMATGYAQISRQWERYRTTPAPTTDVAPHG